MEEETQQQSGGCCRNNLCCALCSIFCCPPCPSSIVAKYAFMPPTCTYTVEMDPEPALVLHDAVTRDGTDQLFSPPGNLHLFKDIKTRRGNTLAAFYLEHPGSDFTIIYSHGNAVDLGLLSLFAATLSQELSISIFAYDYSGYGESTGKASEANLYADIKAAVACLNERFAVPLNRIILYGQSIGTVPSVDFASKNHVAAVVLHSPLMSGIRVLWPQTKRTWCCDPFPSIEKIRRVECPVLVIHGTQDEVIHFSHGERLHAACPGAVEPVWIDGAGHNDIELYSKYLSSLREFVTNMREALRHDEERAASAATTTTATASGQKGQSAVV